MTRRRLWWLGAAAVLAVVVAVQTVTSSSADRPAMLVSESNLPTVTAGVDVLAGVSVVPSRTRGHDYRRAAFGDAWDDDNSAPGGHNGCDTRFLGDSSVLPSLRAGLSF